MIFELLGSKSSNSNEQKSKIFSYWLFISKNWLSQCISKYSFLNFVYILFLFYGGVSFLKETPPSFSCWAKIFELVNKILLPIRNNNHFLKGDAST